MTSISLTRHRVSLRNSLNSICGSKCALESGFSNKRPIRTWRMQMNVRGFSKALAATGSAMTLLAFSPNAGAVPYYWTDWTSWNPEGGTAIGIITPSSGPAVTVNFQALTSTGATGSFPGVADSSLWLPSTAYTSAQVDNGPNYEGLQLVGDFNMTYRVTLSEPIKDPLMAVTTLGAANDSATYVFDSPFTILSQGPTCCWGT